MHDQSRGEEKGAVSARNPLRFFAERDPDSWATRKVLADGPIWGEQFSVFLKFLTFGKSGRFDFFQKSVACSRNVGIKTIA